MRGGGEDGDARAPTSYVELLRTPGALAFVVPAAVGRLPQAMLGVGTVLMVEGLRDSYALAGGVSATVFLGNALGVPVLGRLADRRGQARVALAAVGLHVPALLALVAVAAGPLPAWTLLPLAVAAGASYPPLGSFARVRWRRVTSGPAWDRALAFESVVDEVTFAGGPVLAAVLAVSVWPGAPLVAAALLAAAGTTGFVAARATEPAPAPRPARRDGRLAVTERGMPPLIVALVLLGGVFGSVEVGVVAVTDAAGVAVAAGPILGGFAVASLVGGLVYGARAWRGPPRWRLAASATLLGLATLALPWADGVVALGAVLALTGLLVAPTLIGSNAVVATLVRPAALTEGFAWVGVALLAGTALGSAATGGAVDAYGPSGGLWLAAGLGFLLVAAAWVAARAASVADRPAGGPGDGPAEHATRDSGSDPGSGRALAGDAPGRPGEV